MTQQQFPGDGAVQPNTSAPDPGSYPHNDDHTAIWGTDLPNNTPIARAWARLFDNGLSMGAPTSREYTLSTSQAPGVRQNFEFAYAILDPRTDLNPNLTVKFFDGRGFIAQESGI